MNRPVNLAFLDNGKNLQEKLQDLFLHIQQRFSFIDRMAIAVYDEQLAMLKSVFYFGQAARGLRYYDIMLKDVPSLHTLYKQRRLRVVADLTDEYDPETRHGHGILDADFRSSLTYPLWHGQHFLGFIFFNSVQPRAFVEEQLSEFELHSRLIADMLFYEKQHANTLLATVRSVVDIAARRHAETGGHLHRIARYSRLIAKQLAPKYGLDERYVEHIFLFSPLHDIGKLAIPDEVLQKPGKLDKNEFELMKRHTEKGRELVDILLHNFGMEESEHANMMRNIAEYHHEAVDGTGYPAGLVQDAIPLEARIVAVADVYDALLSERCYKAAWPQQEAVTQLQKMAGHHLDAECVEALISQLAEARIIQEQVLG
jgi:HD-GYP domain-containing protein (c-di-GMP phosphodiesterase class II)